MPYRACTPCLSRRAAVTLCLSLLLTGNAACAGGGGTGPSEDPGLADTYELVSVEEIAVPVRIHEGPLGQYYDYVIADVNGGWLELEDDGEFVMEFDVWISWDGEVEVDTRRTRGYWERQGSQVVLSLPNMGQLTGTYEDGVIQVTLNAAGTGEFFTYAFAR